MEGEIIGEPRSLGRYELVHALGQGGMGEVFLAKISGAVGFEKPCIIKTILPALLKDRQFVDRFHHEAKVLVHLVHSNIAQVFDMGEAADTYFMALEYVAGVDLSQLLEEARNKALPIPIPIAVYLGARMAEGLGYAHRKTAPDGTPLGIVHRDVSPHNVMVGYEGELKVIDFGLARSAARSRYTLPTTVMGKLGYMSPEQAKAEPLDHRTDIYACGLVLWELLAGRPAISGGTVGELMAAMSNPKIPSLCEVRPEIPDELDAIVRQAIEPDCTQRYARANDFARKLNEHLMRSGSTIGAEEVGQFVRTVCPEAFAAQRQLISKLSTVSTMKRTPIPLESPVPLADTVVTRRGALVSGDSESNDEGVTETALAATHVRGASDMSTVTPPRTGPRTAWVVSATAVLMLAAVGVTTWASRTEIAPGPNATKASATKSPVASPSEVEPIPAATIAPEKDTENPVDSAPSADGGGVAEALAVAAETKPEPGNPQDAKAEGGGRRAVQAVQFVSPERVARLITDRSGTFVRAGHAEGLMVGNTLQIVGRPGKGRKRKVLGTATILEVHPKLARIAFDADAKRSRERKFVALPTEPVTGPSVQPAAATASEGVPVVADPAEAMPRPGATAHPGAQMASTQTTGTDERPAQQVEATPDLSAEPSGSDPKKLSGRITVGGAAMFRHIVLHNADAFDWTDCTLFIREDGKYPARYRVAGAIAAGENTSVELRNFQRDPSARMVHPSAVGVTCAEGDAELVARW